MKFFTPSIAVISCLAWSASSFAELKVEADKENVVASRLEGGWCQDASLSERLNGRKLTEQPTEPAITFKSDPTITSKLPEKFGEFLKDKKIYMAGICTFHGAKQQEQPFLLIEHHGNPHVIWFRERNGEPYGDAESMNISLAPATDKENDLLLMGGDFNRGPFRPFRRAKAEAAK